MTTRALPGPDLSPPTKDSGPHRWQVERELARGGMGTVYLARDSRHDRHVALKILRPENAIAGGAERFLSEVDITACLAHPHILPLLDSGVADGSLYLVTPYIAGESLRARLQRQKRLPLPDALRISIEIAEALDYAHRRGIVHCDIKPENVLLADGHALVADFGVARALAASGTRMAGGNDPVVFGSPGYMSPEVLTGRCEPGIPSDIYALGCILFEFLTGERPGGGESARELFRRRPDVPLAVADIVAASLAIDPERRPASAAAVLRVLESAWAEAPARAAAPQPSRRRALRWAGASLMLALMASVVIMARTANPTLVPMAEPRKLTHLGNARQAAISPDGQFIAYVLERGGPAGDSVQLLVQDMSGGDPRLLMTAFVIYNVEWSPDGTRLLVGSRGRYFVVPRLGGTVRMIAFTGRTCGISAHWLPDSRRMSLHCGRDDRIRVIDLETMDSVVTVLRGPPTWLQQGSWSPDGRLFVVATVSENPVTWSIQVVHPDGHMEPIAVDSVPLSAPRWSADGTGIYFIRRDVIRHMAIASRTGRPRGPPMDIHRSQDLIRASASGSWPQLSLTRDERQMVFTRGTQHSNLVSVDPGPDPARPINIPLTEGTALHWSPTISPDGRWIAFARETDGVAELYRMPVEGGAVRQLTFGARVWRPSRIAWSPDGRQIAYVSFGGGHARVWIATVESGMLRSLPETQASIGRGHLAWAPGARIAYLSHDHRNIRLVDPVDGAERLLIADPPDNWFLFSPRYSPDGNRLAAWWNREPVESGVFLFDLRTASSMRVPSAGWPLQWSGEGRHLDVYSFPYGRIISRIDLSGKPVVKRVVTLPYKEVECTSGNPARPAMYVCAVFEMHSDVWMIENPLRRAKR